MSSFAKGATSTADRINIPSVSTTTVDRVIVLYALISLNTGVYSEWDIVLKTQWMMMHIILGLVEVTMNSVWLYDHTDARRPKLQVDSHMYRCYTVCLCVTLFFVDVLAIALSIRDVSDHAHGETITKCVLLIVSWATVFVRFIASRGPIPFHRM
jgi:hypothetical protein